MADSGEIKAKVKVEGTKQAAQNLKEVETGFQHIKKTAIETKVAIVYAIAKMKEYVSSGFDIAKTLEKTSALTGMSTNVLQKYGNTMDKFGYSASDFYSSATALAKNLSGVTINKAGPAEYANVNTALRSMNVREIDNKEILSAMKTGHWETIIDKINQLMQNKNIPLQRRVEMAESMGMDDSVSAAMIRGQLNRSALASSNEKNPPVKDEDLNRVERAGQFFTKGAKTSEQLLLKTISGTVKGVDALNKFGETLTNEGAKALTGLTPQQIMDKNEARAKLRAQKHLSPAKIKSIHKIEKPAIHKTPGSVKNDVKINLNFYGDSGDNATQVASEVSTAVRDAYVKLSAKTQVS